jgi:hypothetical protein
MNQGNKHHAARLVVDMDFASTNRFVYKNVEVKRK